jgi:hypothetical protein
LRRVVRSPQRWQRIVALAAEFGEQLPGEPDAPALNAFLLKRRAADPLRFPDLSLTIIKLLGRGEYVAGFPGQAAVGHFGLAVSEYTHSTAPNRRYPDLVTQRLVRAALARHEVPYDKDELGALAAECTLKEDGAQKVERMVRKAAAACLLTSRIGQQFDGVVTGASAKGTWVRVFDPPVEGRVERGQEGLEARRGRSRARAARAHQPGARLHRLRTSVEGGARFGQVRAGRARSVGSVEPRELALQLSQHLARVLHGSFRYPESLLHHTEGTFARLDRDAGLTDRGLQPLALSLPSFLGPALRLLRRPCSREVLSR